MEEIFHVFNRGVEKRTIAKDENDYIRFILGLTLYNSAKTTPPLHTYTKIRDFKKLKSVDLKRMLADLKPQQNPLVEILAFCLMKNHFHLVLRAVVENGISMFMHKHGTGYTMIFNKKYGRVGPLFQGTYKAVLVEHDTHFLHLPFYIHLNPLDFVEPGWREGNIKNPKRAFNFLDTYPWSSHHDYLGKGNFSTALSLKTIKEIFPSTDDYRKELKDFLFNLNTEFAKNLDV